MKKVAHYFWLLFLFGCISEDHPKNDPFVNNDKDPIRVYAKYAKREDETLYISSEVSERIIRTKDVYKSLESYSSVHGPFLNLMEKSIVFYYHDSEGYRIDALSRSDGTTRYLVLGIGNLDSSYLTIYHSENKLKLETKSYLETYVYVPSGLEKWLGSVVLKGEYVDSSLGIKYRISENEIVFQEKKYSYSIGYDFVEMGRDNFIHINIDDRQMVVGYRTDSSIIRFFKSIQTDGSVEYEDVPFLVLRKVKS